jgi:hypothetical protein
MAQDFGRSTWYALPTQVPPTSSKVLYDCLLYPSDVATLVCGVRLVSSVAEHAAQDAAEAHGTSLHTCPDVTHSKVPYNRKYRAFIQIHTEEIKQFRVTITQLPFRPNLFAPTVCSSKP